MVLYLLFTITSLVQASFDGSSRDFLPKGDCEQIVLHNHLSLCYSSEHRQSSWVTHLLTKESINGRQGRTNNFRRDLSVDDPVGSRDYKGSGFDRGHLAPAGDMKLSYEMMSESFYMTNMSPQRSAFNSGKWRSLESFIRKKVKLWGDAYIVTAPYLKGEFDTIWSGVSIPDFYYKIAYFPEENIMIAYFMPNKRLTGHDLEEFLVSVDELEELTGFDFFSELPDDVEDMLESKIL